MKKKLKKDRLEPFMIRLNQAERDALKILARHYKMSQSAFLRAALAKEILKLESRA